ncbi:MAG TPA: VWA domain-containing protein [Allosphingosinicella sp.]|nr:VWA domain-containing protein [Allosphingosinicella sp.]
MTRPLHLLALSAAFFAMPTPLAAAQSSAPPEQEDQTDDMSIVVTGSVAVRQGGAQDVRHFRSVAADVSMPRPESLTVEGLMGEHDLTLPGRRCAQLFCLVGEAMPAALPTRPDDRLFVGLGFASNIDAATWRREPLNLVAVIDKSGSMAGNPLDLVRRSLRQIVGQMRDGDQLSIVLYGDSAHLYLAPTPIAGNRGEILRQIDRIENAGSTFMEAGLEVGYATAEASAPAFRGNTRVMLFTDEQPNVGRTDAASFMVQAEDASRRGIGLTTIGVGVQFDATLATRVGSVHGGNLFFISSPEEVASVFERNLDTMVSQLAHDVRITMRPRDGYAISGVFGVPDGLMTEGEEGAVTIMVPTAFLSTNGGGIFLSLAKSGARDHLPAAAVAPGSPLLEVSLTYVGARDRGQGMDALTVLAPASAGASAPLRTAHLLVDEYFALHGATTAFHQRNDPREAFALLTGLSNRLEHSGLAGLNGERRLVDDMLQRASFYAGYRAEAPASLRHMGVIGTWRVRRAEGFEDIRSGDTMAFEDGELTTVRANPRRNEQEEESEVYRINARQIFLTDSNLVFDYRASGDRMTLVDDSGMARLYLTRIASAD